MSEQERKAALAGAIARGSDPEAIAEAGGDFGPGGMFADDDENCPRCGGVNWGQDPDGYLECASCRWPGGAR